MASGESPINVSELRLMVFDEIEIDSTHNSVSFTIHSLVDHSPLESITFTLDEGVSSFAMLELMK